ncbi:hypothetical protein CK203_059901 [Vitis vinifera]|uniref:Uncharacterized protein n=1 Tax=Vitis vinifera TaxID=29760 RepID=A0A438GNS1_VITVI|nr:hypothetical protein CK203_059901 [Vitis vinifera]
MDGAEIHKQGAGKHDEGDVNEDTFCHKQGMDQLDMLYLWPFMQDWKYSVEISGFSSFSSSSCSELDSFFLFQILAIPAIPLTMSAGLLFGTLIGTIIVSISGTVRCFLLFGWVYSI